MFWIAVSVSVYAKWTENLFLDHLSVPFLTFLLIIDYSYKRKQRTNFIYAFICCLLGDVLIMTTHINYFVTGLTAYWGACLFFLFSILDEFNSPISVLIKKNSKLFIPILLYTLYIIVLMCYLKPALGDLFVPVGIYALTLSSTCGISFLYYLYEKNKTGRYMCLGFFFFSVAATFVGLNQFVLDIPKLKVLESLFYGPALYYIYLFYLNKKDAEFFD